MQDGGGTTHNPLPLLSNAKPKSWKNQLVPSKEHSSSAANGGIPWNAENTRINKFKYPFLNASSCR